MNEECASSLNTEWCLTVQNMFLAQEPDSNGEREPDERRENEGLSEIGARQPDPNDKCESGEADAAHGCAEGVDSGDDATAMGSIETGAGFVLFFMSFNEAGTRREDGGKGKEEAANDGPESLRDQTGDYADSSAEYEADDPFVGLDAFDRREPGMHDHGGYLTTSQNTHEAANHTGMRAMVAVRARCLTRSSIQLTDAA